MRWHFSKQKNAFAKCAGISQNRKMALQNALAFLKNEKWFCKMRWHFSKLKNAFAKCVGIS